MVATTDTRGIITTDPMRYNQVIKMDATRLAKHIHPGCHNSINRLSQPRQPWLALETQPATKCTDIYNESENKSK